MSWLEYHKKSERFASDADVAGRSGDTAQAMMFYSDAAAAETQAISHIDISKRRTFSITVVSAVALWYKARDYPAAENLAYKWLGTNVLESFAVHQLQDILRKIWDERAQEAAGIKFTAGDVFVAVRGGEIVTGGAPMDLVLRKGDEISAILYRTAELLLGEPHRRRGTASPFIQEICRPWFFQAVPTSYRFAIRVQQPTEQLDLFPENRLQIEKVVPTFLSIVKASTEDPDRGLDDVVPDRQYRVTFLKLVRNLAPTGKRFHELDFESYPVTSAQHIVLVPETRVAINKALRRYHPPQEKDTPRREVLLSGILRGLQLDEDWLEITVRDTEGYRTIRIYEAGETLDDVVGPLVNREVIVDTVVLPNGRHLLRGIQGAE
jgi:hypothetical protein